MARNKSSKFDIDPAADLNFGLGSGATSKTEPERAQEQQTIEEAQEITEQAEKTQKQLPTEEKLSETQGRKGQKLRRINMAFSDENYIYIKMQAIQQGITATQFVNNLIKMYRLDEE